MPDIDRRDIRAIRVRTAEWRAPSVIRKAFMSTYVPSASLDYSVIVGKLRAVGCVFAEDEARLLIAEARTAAELAQMVARRVEGLPLEHVLGWAQFAGLRIAVASGVFVPRRRTELLVREAAALARQSGGEAPVVVVDLCCGSGAVGAAVAAALTDSASARRIELHAADIDAAAVECARLNVASAGGLVYQGDLFEALPASLRRRINVLIANVPYVPTADIALLPPEARDHEPRVALDGGADGLDLVRRVAAGAPRWLAPDGALLVEASERQAPRVARIMARSGLIARVARDEELNATGVVAVHPESDRRVR